MQLRKRRILKSNRFNRLIVTKFILILFIALTVSAAQTLPSQPINMTFNGNEIGKFPSGWKSMNGNGAARIYSVKAEGEHTFLQMP